MKKKFLIVFLSALMVIITPAIASATDKTRDEALAWAQSQVGKTLDYDGAYGAQCVDLIKYYYAYLGVTPVLGNGCDYATNALPDGWQRLQGATPEPGDILVYSASTSNPAGHVAIYESDYAHYNQNVSGKQQVIKCTWHYTKYEPYWGVIRPNFAGSPTPTPKRDGLELGDRGDDVKKLQETLNGITGTSLGTDGYFGPNTEKAVKAYQQKKGLNADGWYGPKTKTSLEDEVKKLQETLNGMTGASLNADGWYGSNTQKAVKAYQQKKGLTVDGWYGASTKAVLEGEVKTLQNMLNAVTGTSLGADGWYGPNTEKAVKAYQQKKGLNADGRYGDITKAALEADYNDLTSPFLSTPTTTPTTAPAPTSAPISTPGEALEPEIPEQPSIGESTPDTANKDDGSFSVLTVYSGDTLQIAVDDRIADFGDAQPFIDENDRTQVPIRAVSELLDCTVGWDSGTRSATITRENGDSIVIAIGSDEMVVNGSRVKMDTAALIVNDRTYIPLRFIAEALGLTVEWI